MVDIHELEKFSNAFVQIKSRLFFLLVVWEGKDCKGVDLHCPTEFRNPQRRRDLAKHFPIGVELVTPYMKVFHSVHLFFLFARITLDTSWLASGDTSGVTDRVRLEDGPQNRANVNFDISSA
jgi:hypothetical protein